ncbi:MAG: ABC transporter permease [Bdellovibrionales bacterium]|nr:ABC transporter permease [Bdellovibrionales bacterium]
MLFGISICGFFILQTLPGGPVEQQIQTIKAHWGLQSAEHEVPPQVIQSLRVQYGMDQPLWKQFLDWCSRLLRADLGISFSYQRPVLEVIGSKLAITMFFGMFSLFVTYFIALPLGVIWAKKDLKWLGAVINFHLLFLYSVPPLLLAIYLHGYFDFYFSEVLLPCFCYSLPRFVRLTSLTRNLLLDEMSEDYIRTARAKGLSSEAAMHSHAMKNALIPLINSIPQCLVLFLTGSLIVEQIFGIDGIGQLGYRAAQQRDYPLLMGLILFQAVLLVFAKFFTDMAFVFVDPRVEFRK